MFSKSIFEDGFLTVPANNPVLQQFLYYHPQRDIVFEEVDKERDGNPKGPDSIHRWHLAAFGGGRYFNCTMGGSFASFDDPVVTQAFQNLVKSFKIQ